MDPVPPQVENEEEKAPVDPMARPIIKKINTRYIKHFEQDKKEQKAICSYINERTFLEKIRFKKIDREACLHKLALEPLEVE